MVSWLPGSHTCRFPCAVNTSRHYCLEFGPAHFPRGGGSGTADDPRGTGRAGQSMMYCFADQPLVWSGPGNEVSGPIRQGACASSTRKTHTAPGSMRSRRITRPSDPRLWSSASASRTIRHASRSPVLNSRPSDRILRRSAGASKIPGTLCRAIRSVRISTATTYWIPAPDMECRFSPGALLIHRKRAGGITPLRARESAFARYFHMMAATNWHT